jgi:hypothetical protein
VTTTHVHSKEVVVIAGLEPAIRISQNPLFSDGYAGQLREDALRAFARAGRGT